VVFSCSTVRTLAKLLFKYYQKYTSYTISFEFQFQLQLQLQTSNRKKIVYTTNPTQTTKEEKAVIVEEERRKEEKEQNMSSPLSTNSKPVVVVGAGLAGSLLAVFLRKKGFEVTLYERRVDMRKEHISAGRSINLAMSERAMNALRQVGLVDSIMEIAIPMRGRMMHAIDGKQVRFTNICQTGVFFF